MKEKWLWVGFGVLFLTGSLLAEVQRLNGLNRDEIDRVLPRGGSARLERVFSRAEAREIAFNLRRIEVFTPDAVILEVSDRGVQRLPVPRNLYFAGEVAGEEGSTVFLSIFEDGEMRGLVTRKGGASEMLGGDERPARWGDRLELERVSPQALERAAVQGSFECGTESIWDPASLLEELEARKEAASPPLSEAPLFSTYAARVAIETDFEFYQKFNNTQRAINYIGDLIGYASRVYETQVNTHLNAHFIRIWSTSSDPWTEGDSICSLFQLGKYWNDNETSTSRTIVHMMSGKGTGGGVAWVGVLCAGPFNYTVSGCSFCSGSCNVGGGYGFTGNMSGTFSPNNPTVMWDIVAVAHEIGHNFNSPHTHCYAGIGGNPSHVDHCYGSQSGCYSGTPTLPGVGSTSGGTPGAGNGTIMSYCHLISPGFSNVSFTLGQGHPFGVAPNRVPTRMNQHVVAQAGSNPACLAFTAQDYIFADSFESGNTSRWALGS